MQFANYRHLPKVDLYICKIIQYHVRMPTENDYLNFPFELTDRKTKLFLFLGNLTSKRVISHHFRFDDISCHQHDLGMVQVHVSKWRKNGFSPSIYFFFFPFFSAWNVRNGKGISLNIENGNKPQCGKPEKSLPNKFFSVKRTLKNRIGS